MDVFHNTAKGDLEIAKSFFKSQENSITIFDQSIDQFV